MRSRRRTSCRAGTFQTASPRAILAVHGTRKGVARSCSCRRSWRARNATSSSTAFIPEFPDMQVSLDVPVRWDRRLFRPSWSASISPALGIDPCNGDPGTVAANRVRGRPCRRRRIVERFQQRVPAPLRKHGGPMLSQNPFGLQARLHLVGERALVLRPVNRPATFIRGKRAHRPVGAPGAVAPGTGRAGGTGLVVTSSRAPVSGLMSVKGSGGCSQARVGARARDRRCDRAGVRRAQADGPRR